MKFKLSALILALLASSVTLWLIESPLKYAFYFFEASLILILLYSLFGKARKIKFETNENIVIKFDYAFLMVSTLLLIFNVLKLDNVLTLLCAILVSFFLPGYVLLRLLNFHTSDSWIEWPVLSFALSIGITSLIYTVILPFTLNRAVLLSVVSVGISLCLLIKDRIYRYGKKQTHLENITKDYNIFDVLLLLWITLFFFFVILSLYPQMTHRPGLDIVRHFSSSRLLALAPDAYSSSYPWFHATWANVYELTSTSMEIFQTGLAYLSIMSIFSFYIMAKAYLKEIDKRAPILATVFFSIFAGLGWLYFLQERIINADTSAYYSILNEAHNISYFDVGYAQGWIWFWFRPLTLGLTLFFSLLYLLRQHKLSKGTFILISTLMLLTLNFIHFSESVVFVLFLLFLSLVKPIKPLRLSEAATSSALAMLISLPLLFSCQEIIGMSEIGPPSSHLMLLAITSVVAILFARFKRRPDIKISTSIHWLTIGASLIYVWLITTWLLTAKSFSLTSVIPVYTVPWQFYTILLGLSGFFAILSSTIVIKRYSKHPLTIFILLLLFMVLFGRALTYYNLNVGVSSYWERRIIPIAYAASAILAPVSIIELLKHIQKCKTIFLAAFMSFLVISSVSSTFLAVELQFHTIESYALNDDDLTVVNALNELSPNKILLTSTDSSRLVAEFTPSSWIIDKYRYQLWAAKYPELPLNVLYSLNKPVTIFLREIDIQEINNKYASSYIPTHLMLYSSANNSTNIPEITSLPNMTAPSSNSQTVLVLNGYQDPATWYSYDILSQSRLSYTTALIDDISTISKAKTVIAPTENIALKLISYRELFKLKFENLVILNLNGYENLSLNYFSSSQMKLSLDNASSNIATLNDSGVTVENLTTFIAPKEFEICSIYETGHFYGLLDETLEGWMPSGISSGNISPPKLTLNNSDKMSGTNSIQIDVTSGTYGFWQIRKDFTTATDADAFDFISFYWYGKGDGTKYVLNFHSTVPNNYWYYFTDLWTGWKKVLIPMHISDGSYNLNGVDFVKVTNGEPTWNNLSRIEIRNEGSNPNVAGKFLIDKLGFESAETINVTITTDASFPCFGLLNYNSTNWVSIAEITSNESIFVSNYTLRNALNSITIFGDRSFLKISTTEKSDSSIATISVKLPPYLNNTNFNSIQLKIIPMIQYAEVDKISSPNTSIQLDTKINAIPLETRNNVIAWYNNEEQSIPFAVKDDTNGLNIVYVNLYPLTTTLVSIKSNYEILGQIAKILNLNQLISEAQISAENPVSGNLATFNKIDFEGNTTIHSPASVIIEKMDNTLTLTLPNTIITDLSRILVIGDEIILNATNGSLHNGMGFYSNIYSDKLIITSATGSVESMILEFNNGTKQAINEAIHNIHIYGKSVTTLRQPTIHIDGKITLYNLYTYASLSNLNIFGKDAYLEGNLYFDINFGDEFTVTDNFTYTGKIITNEYRYDELNVLYQSLPIFLVTGLVFIIAYASIRLAIKKPEPTGTDK